MRWSIPLGHVAGIALRLHVTFLLLLGWFGFSYYLRGGLGAAAYGLAFILAIFASVILHEFGHAIAARRYGIRTPDITLLPIGGVARLERMPDQPRAELVVALAGPAVNVLIALVLYLGLSAAGLVHALSAHLMGPAGWFGTSAAVGAAGGFGPTGAAVGRFATQLMGINLWLVAFNLIPAFPMDGGRVLRAILAERMPYGRATQIAAGVGQGFAFLFAALGFFGNPLLLFIALFVYLGATGEASTAPLRDFADAIPVAGVMATDLQALRADTTLAEAATQVLHGLQHDFPITGEGGVVVGMLERGDIIRGLTEHGSHTPIRVVMQTGVPHIDRREMLRRAFERLLAGRHAALPVVDEADRLVGLITREHLAEVLMLQGAQRRRRDSVNEASLV